MFLSISTLILSGLIGGLIASMVYPFVIHIGLRSFNKSKVKIFVDESDPLNCRVSNNSFVTLKNVIAYISINNDKNDLLTDTRIQVFCADKTVFEDRLSWSKNIDGKNLPEIDIHQGEVQKLNLARLHKTDPCNGLEIASEQGFFDTTNKSRAILSSSRDYIFKIKLIGDNLWPIEKKFAYNHLTQQISIS